VSSIAKLRVTLAEVLKLPLATPVIPALLERELQELSKIVAAGGGSQPPRDRMQEAIMNFRRFGEFQGLAEARLACFGSAEHFAPREPALIEDRQEFPRLLNAVDKYSDEPRPFRRCYRGLLHVYFLYDGESAPIPEAQSNWLELRDFLHRKEPAIRVEGFQPDWAKAIQTNKNLLTSDPAARYAKKLLEGDSSEVDELRAHLEIQQGSWLMRKLVLAQIALACNEPDLTFRGRVDALLGLVKKDELLANQGLALILDRYVRMANRPQQARLLESAISQWGNPTFRKNAPKWSWASDAAKSMISSWATLDLIRRFFEVLSEDRKTDQRRVEFWQRYHEQIDRMYFALGSSAMRSRDADIDKLRKEMGDRLLFLKQAGNPSNNAFIMVMGKLVAVEFGIKGNACYLYREDALPFSLRGTLTGEDLRSEDRIARLLHMDSKGMDWEEKFAHELSTNGVHHGGPSRGRRLDQTQDRGAPKSRQSAEADRFSRKRFERFAEEHSLDFIDNTRIGGSIKVKLTDTSGALAEILKKWGFRYSENRQFWWRKDWNS